MSRQITMPEKDDEPSQSEINAMNVTECVDAMRDKLADYKRRHGLQVVNGLGMQLFQRATDLLTLYQDIPAAPVGYKLVLVAEKHLPTVQSTIDFLNQTDPV